VDRHARAMNALEEGAVCVGGVVGDWGVQLTHVLESTGIKNLIFRVLRHGPWHSRFFGTRATRGILLVITV